jgi:two-component system NarL family sensor kinase
MKKLLFILCLLLGFGAKSYSQEKTIIDSLKTVLLSASDSTRVKVLNELCWQSRSSSPKEAFIYGRQALRLATSLNFETGIAQAHNDLGILYYDKRDYHSALDHYYKALQIRKNRGDKFGIAAIYNKIGLIQEDRGELKAALKSQLKCLQLYKNLGAKNGLAQTLNNLAVIHQAAGNFDLALPYLQQSLDLQKKTHDQEGYAATLSNLAQIYEKQKNPSQAIAYNEQALATLRHLHNREYMAGVLHNLAILYSKTEHPEKSLVFAREAYQIREQLGDKKGQSAVLLTQSRYYFNRHDLVKATALCRQAHILATQIEASSELSEGLHLRAQILAAGNNYPLAYQALLQYSLLQDSLAKRNLNHQLQQIQDRYENNRIADHIALLNRQKQLQQLKIKNQELQLNKGKNKLKFITLAFVAVVITGLFLFNRIQLKQRIRQKLNQLNQQKQRSLAIMETEEKERKRIGTEIHDGLGQLLSIARLNIAGLQEELPLATEMQEQLLRNAIQVLDEAYNEIRTISHNLNSDSLRQQGLARSIQHLIEPLTQTGRFKLDLEIIGLQEEPVPPIIEKVVYRVVQECLNNIFKHAGATQINMQLIRHDSELTVMIEDNGKGFDQRMPEENSGIGLNNIRSRIEYLNGTVHIDSVLNRGTIVILEIPLTQTSTPSPISYESITTKHKVITGR